MKICFRMKNCRWLVLVFVTGPFLGGCVQGLFHPTPITHAQLQSAGVGNSQAIRQARQGVAQAKGAIADSERAYAKARNEANAAQQRFDAARQYKAWQQLELEKARLGRELAQAEVSLAQSRVEAAEAQAVASHQSNPKDSVNVGAYRREVSRQESHVTALKQNLQELKTRIREAHEKYIAAQRAWESVRGKGGHPDEGGTESGDKPSGGTTGTRYGASSGQQEQSDSQARTPALQGIHPAGKVINQEPLENQPGQQPKQQPAAVNNSSADTQHSSGQYQ